MTEKEALILLNRVEGVGPRSLFKIKECFPDVASIFGKSAAEIQEKCSLNPEGVRHILDAPRKVDLQKELDFIRDEKIKVLSLWEEGYPALLKEIYDPPCLLYMKGEYDFALPCVALVGARISTLYGNQTAYRLAFQLASAGLGVVSGLARGIDTHSHLGALAAKGVTVGVMGCGMRYFYPKENRSLGEKMLERGCLLTEFPSEAPPVGIHFPRRNRIISGLSLGVVVVEAARKSGSLITADLALEQGRSVFAVPGQVDSPSAMGTLGLIKEGAKLVQTVEDILEELNLEVKIHRSENSREQPFSENPVLKILTQDPLNVDEISQRVEMKTSQVLRHLFELELKRLVKQLPGKYYVKNSG
ncbi:MAG: DNA-protecting protein DprA [Chlamydiae bacterium]|nr:DNA-protecting protein DprA [Chlamydiota bacterium]MBI3265695.1 DNA-protecting protein DprA [Chlamydiota bacterium]